MSGSLARSTVRPTVSSATYSAANQQTSFNGQTLTYDANGNLTGDGTNTYTWNAKPTDVSEWQHFREFHLRCARTRVTKTVDGATTEYLYDGGNVVQELSSSTPTANMLTGGVDEVFSRPDANGARSLLADGLGSTLTLTD